MTARPFLKFPGGKQLLVEQIAPWIPPTFRRYREPFVGGGSLFWYLGERARKACLADINMDLVRCYRMIAYDVEAVITAVSCMKPNASTYARVRTMFNVRRGDDIWRTAAFLYMNRAGFNGLCRYNRDGGFNVPFAKQDLTPRIHDADVLRACSAALQGCFLDKQGFAASLAAAQPGDFVYLDPPYFPMSVTSDFVAYAPGPRWTTDDGLQLAELATHARNRGVHVLASNSDTDAARAAWRGWRAVKVRRKGTMNSDTSKRGAVSELLFVGTHA